MLSILLFAAVSFAQPENKALLKAFPEKPLLNEIVVFEPQPNHKFNLQSKNNCGSARLIKADESSVQCQMVNAGATDLELFVCDDKKTFCKREELKVETASPKGVGGWVGYLADKVLKSGNWSAPYRSNISRVKPARGFSHNDLAQALSLAAKENKNLFVYFTQASCGPCRQMKELTFASDEFQEASKNLVRVQIDIDQDIEPEKIKPLELLGTPTVIIFNKDFAELNRTLMVMSPKSFDTWIRATPNQPIEALLDKPVSSLSETELWHLSSWSYERRKRAEDKSSLAVKYAAALPDSPKAKFWQQALQIEEAKDIKQKYAAYVSSQPNAQDLGLPLHAFVLSGYDFVGSDLGASERAKLTALHTQLAIQLGKNSSDPLQAAYEALYAHSAVRYIEKKANNQNAVKKANASMREILQKIPRLPGVNETPYLAIMIAENADDPQQLKDSLEQNKKKNAGDYSYDFWAAGEAMDAKNYDEALRSIDESLKVACDRGWQKAFLMKIDILREMKRKDEAKRLIETTLSEIDLPYAESPKIHTFVQQLRAAQKKLQES